MNAVEFVEYVRKGLAEYDASQPGPTPDPKPVFVPAGGSVQDALDAGATAIDLEAGQYDAFVISHPVFIRANGAVIYGDGRPAIYITPRTTDVEIGDFYFGASHQAALQIGDNGVTQTSREQAPQRIRLVNPKLVRHALATAKNGIENNGWGVEIVDAQLENVFNPNQVESHVIATINTPGGLLLRGGVYSGGSIVCFTGGDAIDIPDTDIEDVTYIGVTITRPKEWQSDGINRNIKNLIEFKNVTRATVNGCTLFNSWGTIQSGFAVVLTPKVDGRVVDVEFSRNVISNVGAGFNITGRNPTGADPTRTDNIRIVDNNIAIDKVAYAGVGWPFLLQDGPGRIRIEHNTIQHNGNALVYVDDRDRIASLIIRGNTANVGAYGIRTPAGNNGDNWSTVFDELIVEENVFSGASAVFKRNFPNNTYV